MYASGSPRSAVVRAACGSLLIAAGVLRIQADALADTPDLDAAARTEPTAIDASNGLGVIIPIHTEITDITVESVKRRLDEALERGAKTIIFELDTPGGLVTSTFKISDYIRNLPKNIKTVAWVNTTAHSGGALVAISCGEIIMARSSRIGDAQVIFGNPIGPQAIPEDLKPKLTTPVLAEVRQSARLRGYSQVLCEAFVDPEREVWWLENIETGERKFVFREEKVKLLGETESPQDAKQDKDADADADTDIEKGKMEEAPTVSSTADASGSESKWRPVKKYYDVVLDMEVDAIQPTVRDDQLLQMSASEAYAYGFSKGIATSESEVRDRYQLTSLIRINPLWSESLALWMTSMWVRGFLLLLIMLGAYVEFHTPGVGVPGLVALICLAIFVGAPYMTGLANVWEILFILVGLLLIGLEVFVIPGFGVAGITGIALLLIGLLATFIPDLPNRPLYIPTLPSAIDALKVGIITLVCSMFASLIGIAMLSRFLPRIPVLGNIVPPNPTPSEVQVDDPYRGAARIGDIGETAGTLRPAGKARFGSQLVDVVTQGEYLDVGAKIEVIERRGNRVVVRAVK